MSGTKTISRKTLSNLLKYCAVQKDKRPMPDYLEEVKTNRRNTIKEIPIIKQRKTFKKLSVIPERIYLEKEKTIRKNKTTKEIPDIKQFTLGRKLKIGPVSDKLEEDETNRRNTTKEIPDIKQRSSDRKLTIRLKEEFDYEKSTQNFVAEYENLLEYIVGNTSQQRL